MAVDIFRLKKDIMTFLGNEQYYLQEELQSIIDDVNLTQRERVNKSIDLLEKLFLVDGRLNVVNTLFPTQQAQEPVGYQPTQEQEPIEEKNVVQHQFNEKGQSHSE